MRLAPIGLMLGLVMMSVPFWAPRLMGMGQAQPTVAARPAPAPGTPVGDAFAGVMAALERAKGVAGVAGATPTQPAATTLAPRPTAAPPFPPAPGTPMSPDRVQAMADALIAEACAEFGRTGKLSEAECRKAAAAGFAAQQAQRAGAPRLPQVAQPKRSQRPPDAKFVKVQP